MPRGVRKSPTEKLKEELQSTQEAIAQYKSAIKTLEDKEKEIQKAIELEEFKEVRSLLNEKSMSVSELKELLTSSPQDE